jgi:hypothetical protein
MNFNNHALTQLDHRASFTQDIQINFRLESTPKEGTFNGPE